MNYYQTLGVDKSATTEQIKKAYKKLAVQHHPDKNPGSVAAVAKFKEVSEAFSVLSDPSKRSQYDVQGYVGRRRAAPPKPKPKPKPKPPPPPPKPDDIPQFRERYRDRYAKRNPTQAELDAVKCTPFGVHLMAHLYLTKDELKKGGTFWVKVKRHVACDRCLTDGNVLIVCPACQGNRYQVAYCMICDGLGHIHEDPCKQCKGKGVLPGWEIEDVQVVVPANSITGHQVTVYGVGDPAPRQAPGNLRVTVLEKV